MASVLHEAYELVEDGLMTPDNFRDFVFANPVRFLGEPTPTFSKAPSLKKKPKPCLQALR